MKRGSSGGKKKPFRGQKDLIEDKTTDPLFVKDGGQYYFYHNDHLGTPQKLTAVNGAVVWSAKYSSFGEATVEVETVENNLRFAGQYYDSETGLHYNRHRYYDPSLGRYLRADPIGVAGGMNLYLYANANPIKFIDPEGLNPVVYRGFALAMAAARVAKKQIIKGAKYCKKIRCTIKNHPAHHKFGWPFNKRMPHIQLTCWVKGKKGSHKILRFPYSSSLTGGPGGGSGGW